MAKTGKRYRELAGKVDPEKFYPPEEALPLIKELSSAKFDETVEAHVRTGVDPRHADQMIRGSVILPAGTGKRVRVLAFAQGEQAREAEEAGADFVGAEDLVQRLVVRTRLVATDEHLVPRALGCVPVEEIAHRPRSTGPALRLGFGKLPIASTSVPILRTL